MARPKPPNQLTKRSCIECGEDLPLNARRCLKCDSYQISWKRALQFVAKIAGALTLLGGLVVAGIKAFPFARREFAWRSGLSVIEFNTSRGLTVLNSGDGPVLLLDVSLEIEGIGTRSIPINKTLNAGQVIQYDTARRGAGGKESVLLAHMSAADWRAAVAEARVTESPCVEAVVFADIDTDYAIYSDAGRRDPHHFPMLHARAVLHFYDLRAGGKQLEIPTHAFLFRRYECPPYPSEPRYPSR